MKKLIIFLCLLIACSCCVTLYLTLIQKTYVTGTTALVLTICGCVAVVVMGFMYIVDIHKIKKVSLNRQKEFLIEKTKNTITLNGIALDWAELLQLHPKSSDLKTFGDVAIKSLLERYVHIEDLETFGNAISKDGNAANEHIELNNIFEEVVMNTNVQNNFKAIFLKEVQDIGEEHDVDRANQLLSKARGSLSPYKLFEEYTEEMCSIKKIAREQKPFV